MRIAGFIILFVLSLFIGAGTGLCRQPDGEDQTTLENLRKMRMKQQGEENVVRIQQFVNQQATKQQCTPVQQARQRMKDIEAAEGKATAENVNITAGHTTLDATGNNGTINSDINIQIIKNGDSNECL